LSLFDALLLDPYPLTVWIAFRTDGIKGSGTLNDPYDGSTASKFDALMNGFSANTRVQLGPGIFQTQGYSDEVTGGWQTKPGMKIVGSGIDVTTLQLALNPQATNAQIYAIGHALVAAGVANRMDTVEVSDLTVDCNLAPPPPPQWGSAVACGAIRLMGNYAKVRRVKAINWGTNAASGRPCFVIAVITGQVVGSNVTEVAQPGIEECVILQPGGSTYYGPVTLLHAGGKEDTSYTVEAYGKGPFIRNCFVDCGTAAAAANFRALSMGWCRAGIVEGNEVYNTQVGGPYQDKASSRDLVVRNNYYKNVIRGPYWNLGGLSTPATTLSTLVRDPSDPTKTIALATTPSNPHNFQAGERVSIGGVGIPAGFPGLFVIKDLPAGNQFRYQMVSSPSQDAGANAATCQKVFGVNKVVVEGNNVELATTSTAAAIHFEDGSPALETPDYVHGDVQVRANRVRYVDGLFDPTYLGYGTEIHGVKNLTVRDNVVDSAVANPIRNTRCGSVNCFNNKSPANALIQGLQTDVTPNKKYDELQTNADDAFVLAYLKHG